MKFGTLLEYTFLVIFGYRAIADLTCDKIGSHFPIWPPSSLGKRGFVWENCGTYLFSVDVDPLWGPKNPMGVVATILGILKNPRWLPFH